MGCLDVRRSSSTSAPRPRSDVVLTRGILSSSAVGRRLLRVSAPWEPESTASSQRAPADHTSQSSAPKLHVPPAGAACQFCTIAHDDRYLKNTLNTCSQPRRLSRHRGTSHLSRIAASNPSLRIRRYVGYFHAALGFNRPCRLPRPSSHRGVLDSKWRGSSGLEGQQ